MFDLPKDIEEEVLCRIAVTSLRPVRSTCKRWNTLFRCDLFANKHLAHQVKVEEAKEDSLVVMMMDYRVGLMRLNLSNTNNDDVVLKHEAKLIGLDQIDVCEIFLSDGLLLCILKDHSRLVVWNPYWGQPRWIEHTHNYHKVGQYLYGQVTHYRYGFGYDSSTHSHKVLRFIDLPPYFVEFKIYDFNSDSWRILDLLPRDWRIKFGERGVSIKGNTYWFASTETTYRFLVCFDFTRETFWWPLPLPFVAFTEDTLSLSTSVRGEDEQLVVLFQREDTLTMEIWISATTEQPNAVSWNSKVFLSANIEQLIHPEWQFWKSTCFFIDEEKKVAVVFDKDDHTGRPTREIAYIFGVDGSLKQAVVKESSNKFCRSRLCYYVPSLVRLN